jgi:mannosyl-oligosaccharide alpha-1,2-mannosidase
VKEEPVIKLPELKTADEVRGGYGLPTNVPVSAESEEDTAVERPKTTKAPATVPDRKPPSQQGLYQHETDNVRPGYPPTESTGHLAPTSTTVHWQKPSEWFPVPEESLIMLPTGKPNPIPSIQFAFGKESPEAQEKRELRLSKVRAEAQRAWFGYKTYAWTHDELTPVTKRSKDPFCGWAATLVDALDTLWIMGLNDEFDEAVEAVKEIDFGTTPYRSDIPVFETIIRYLGGLLAAYDVTGGHKGKYPALLEKAVELAEILMSVFDTPNRMPILYYNWKPEFNTVPKRAADVSVAEIGSMSMEFTRLAQLTGKNKYYDAIARITDALEDLQNRPNGTAIPGIFPERLDASGCNRTAPSPSTASDRGNTFTEQRANDDSNAPVKSESRSNELSSDVDTKTLGNAEPELKSVDSLGTGTEVGGNVTLHNGLGKRDGPPTTAPEPFRARNVPKHLDCVPQGLTGGGWGSGGSYSMGGSQDSAYEYFPKQYLLLGGLEPKYRTMHEKVVDAVKNYLLYRPMAKDDPDILFSAKAFSPDGTADRLTYEWEVTHLTCFLGGMFGLGGKIFERPEDVEVAKRLTDGCVWAYEVMPTGIMPETAAVMPCVRPDDCHWNQTAWHERLDPEADHRESLMEDYYTRKAAWKKEVEELKEKEARRKQAEEQKRREEAQRKAAEEEERREEARRKAAEEEERKKRPVNNTLPGEEGKAHLPSSQTSDLKDRDTLPRPGVQKRDAMAELDTPGGPASSHYPVSETTEQKTRAQNPQDSLDHNSDGTSRRAALDQDDQKPMSDDLWLPAEPVKPLTHQEYVAQRIEKEHIPPGFVSLNDKRYLLR